MLRQTTAFLAIAMIPACVYAVDGIVLINQSTVNASGGFPYVISQPGSYKLSGNLVATVDHQAILVTASNVNLDLNGFTVTCAFQNPTSVTRCVGDLFDSTVSNLSIRNGVVALSATASAPANIVSFNSSGSVLVEELQIVMNSPEISGFVGLHVGPGSIVRHNIIRPNGSFFGFLNVLCPSVIEGNSVGGIGTFGAGCVADNNTGTITAF